MAYKAASPPPQTVTLNQIKTIALTTHSQEVNHLEILLKMLKMQILIL